MASPRKYDARKSIFPANTPLTFYHRSNNLMLNLATHVKPTRPPRWYGAHNPFSGDNATVEYN